MTKLIKAAGVEVEPIWTNLFARALEGNYIYVFGPSHVNQTDFPHPPCPQVRM